jgi:hypothetical protein
MLTLAKKKTSLLNGPCQTDKSFVLSSHPGTALALAVDRTLCELRSFYQSPKYGF